jgi:hypothetical protein
MKTVSATADGTAITQTAPVTVVPESGATIAHTLLTSGNDPVNRAIYTTAPIAPAPNTLVTIALLSHRGTGAISPTVSGGGMASWTLVTSVDFDTLSLPQRRLSIYRALIASPGSGPITAGRSREAPGRRPGDRPTYSGRSSCALRVRRQPGTRPSAREVA